MSPPYGGIYQRNLGWSAILRLKSEGECDMIPYLNQHNIVPYYIILINFPLPSQCPRPMVEYTKEIPPPWAQFRIDKRGRMWYDSACKVFKLYIQVRGGRGT